MHPSIRTTISPLFSLAIFAFFAVNLVAFRQIAFAASEPPRLFILKFTDLIDSKRRIDANDSTLLPAFTRLKRDADRALESKNLSVTHKELAPPTGDKHDYMSIAPYWWPNPNTSNGLPYIRRDGHVNPERDQTSDRKRLDNLIQSVKVLGLGYFYTGREDYSAHGSHLLRTWFLEEATKMAPHLRYAQAVPGRNQGRGAGIIETHNLPELVDAVGLLSGSKSWSQSDQKSLYDWFDSYLAWLLKDPQARAESKAENNHGTWFDVQIASYALFFNKNEIARNVLSHFSAQRTAKQIEPGGRQPYELERTQAWSYSIFNLEAMFNAAAIADKLGIDLWNYETSDKRSIRKALDYLIPFATGEKKWTYKEISAFEPQKLAPLLRRAAIVYREPAYEEAIAKLPKLTGDERWRFLYPKPLERR